MKALPGHFIHGEWKTGAGLPLYSTNPATGERVFETCAATQSDIHDSFIAAKAALTHWGQTSLSDRISYLKTFGQILDAQQTHLAQAISLETGKPFWESHQEVKAMIGKISISIEAYAQRCPDRESELPHGKSVTRHKPHGVVAVLGPFNFPGHLPNGHIVPALLAGNTVIFKPSEYTPLVGSLIAQCWAMAELPAGVFNLVQGGKETGEALVAHPDLNGLFLTGSWSTGKKLLAQFHERPEILLALEMGGNNPLVVGEIANLQAAAYVAVQSAYLTAGQRCTCARRLILIDNPAAEKFLEALRNMILSLRIGPFTQIPEPFMGPVISSQSAQNILHKQQQLENLGGRCLIRSENMKPDTGLLSPGLMDVTGIAQLPDEEIFGPFLQVCRVKDFQEAIAAANNTQYGLSAGLLSDHLQEYQEFLQNIQAGVINWNTPLTGASSAAPFGGIKRSGNHRPSAFYAADYCSYPVASMESQELKMPTENPLGFNWESK
jgi:succinylglutamic semialdehyde dehydrogenase